MFRAAASRAPKLAASRTIASAAAAFRPCSRASSAMYAAASFTTLRRRSFERSSPPVAIGVEEPMLVCGAIASTSAACPITAPAESALEPDGATQTITGTFAARNVFTISRIDEPSPPGVSISTTSAA